MSTELEIQDHGGALKRFRSEPVPAGDMDMLQYLQDVALGVIESTPLQVKAAIAAIQYTHAKKADVGKREQRQEAARKAANGRFHCRTPPLHAVK
ncbi:hypothetical protein HNP46_004360 [Pseudomonas nitritireducens]|uniref:Uncharacterized protein n=1 Tax=Pseudomonas nitroreducens TaxID=46680 RepID=A0A7W7KMD4_PSENT|nr:hypothetical protein [Pseudomonas nitritireducens]MBB4865466.1 hypothetical protein [Pseudomonas nitritireducens]